MRRKVAFVALIIASILLLSSEFVWAKIYRWKDSNGVVHFTEDPPPPQTSGVSTMESVPSVPSDTSSNIHDTSPVSKDLIRKLRAIKLHPCAMS